MSLISEQVEKLRDLAEDVKCENEEDDIVRALQVAADTIETLSIKFASANMERSSAYYNGGWIPVDERLPETSDDVLVTYKSTDDDDNYVSIAISNYREERFGGKPLGFMQWNPPFEYFRGNYNIVAWMPLPKAYEEE